MASLVLPVVEPQILCYDGLTGRYFHSNVVELEMAVSELNSILFREGDVSLNDFYQLIDLPPVLVGDYFGWSGSAVSLRINGDVTSDNRPVISVGFSPDPKPTPGEVVL